MAALDDVIEVAQIIFKIKIVAHIIKGNLMIQNCEFMKVSNVNMYSKTLLTVLLTKMTHMTPPYGQQ